MGQQRIDENEAGRWKQQQLHALIKKAERNKEQRAAQRSGDCRVEVPQEGRGLRETGVKENSGVDALDRKLICQAQMIL